MKKLSLAFLAMSVIAASGSAFAEPTPGGKGQINFTGYINNDACSVDGAVGKEKAIAVEMGSMSIKDLGTETAPGAGRAESAPINLSINCSEGTKVSMVLDPTAGGSGVVGNTKLLALNPGYNSAKGIGIAIMNSSGEVLDLKTKPQIPAVVNGQDATVSFAAAYVTTGDPKAATPGDGNATLPFTLLYE